MTAKQGSVDAVYLQQFEVTLMHSCGTLEEHHYRSLEVQSSRASFGPQFIVFNIGSIA